MSFDDAATEPRVQFSTTKSQLAQLIRLEAVGTDVAGLFLIDPFGEVAILPAGVTVSRVLVLGNDLVLVQPNGDVYVLLGGTTGDYSVSLNGFEIPSSVLQSAIVPESDWSFAGQGQSQDFSGGRSADALREQGSGSGLPVSAGDPLKGLDIHPLLRPVRYPREERPDQDFGTAYDSPAVPVINIDGSAEFSETDSDLDILISNYIQVSLDGVSVGEFISDVTLTLDGLPAGTVVSGGTLTPAPDGTLTLDFSGSLAAYNALVITFPQDFSTESRTDIAPGDLTGMVTAITNFGDEADSAVTLTIHAEGDADIDDSLPDNVPDETDDATPLVPAELLLPEATDIDGSEFIDTLTLVIEGLPGDGSFSLADVTGLPAGAEVALVTAADGSSTLTIKMIAATVGDVRAAYEGISLSLPADFSTANRSDLDTEGDGRDAGDPTAKPITLTLSIRTSEDQIEGDDTPTDGEATVVRVVDIGFEADITLTAPSEVDGVEDAGGAGVTVDLGIQASVDDADGSETEDLGDPRFAAQVSIAFTDLPDGATVNTGRLDGSTWTGSVAEANALELTLPENYAGEIDLEITVTTPEGSETVQQTVVITGTGDVELDIEELSAAETDSALPLRPSDAWKVIINDPDGSEKIDSVHLELSDLPPGMTFNGTGSATVDYDPAAGTLVFDGSFADYLTFTLIFPKDYSTESPDSDGLTIDGTFSVVSNEGATPSSPVTVRITPEGDAEIDDTLPDNVPDETDDPTPVVPAELLLPEVTDLDGSEEIDTLSLVIEGLPGDGSFTLANITGLPAGAVASLATAADGSATLTLTMTAADVGDVQTAYEGISLLLPADFSTANRSDLDPSQPTSKPLTLTLSVRTNEDQVLGDDTPTDGEATAVRVVDIGFEADIELTVGDPDDPGPLPIPVIVTEEDGGVPDVSVGVTVELPIAITIDDADGSETADTSDPRFAATVQLFMPGLPAGATVNAGTLTGNLWTGTVAEATGPLELSLPGNYAGFIPVLVAVETPEGAKADLMAVAVLPTPDVEIDGEVDVTETDADLNVLLSDFITVLVDDPSEVITGVEFNLPGLPPGTRAIDSTTGADVGTFTAQPGGTVTFDFNSASSSTAPEDVVLVFPKDYSTANPEVTLVAELTVETTQAGIPSTTTGDVAVTVHYEGDIRIGGRGKFNLAETDDVVDFSLSKQLKPIATDEDGSESVTHVFVTLDSLPAGTLYSLDGSPPALDWPVSGALLMTADEYANLVVRLPADFSTQNPDSAITGRMVAITDEGGVAERAITINVAAEGDLELSGSGAITLSENDAPGDLDGDNTTQEPLLVRLTDAVTGTATDADGSESIARVDVTISGLPDGAAMSLDGGKTFTPVASGPSLTLALTHAEHQDLVFRLPDDFSTENPPTTIGGTVTFTTDEAILAGETDTGPDDGIESRDFTVVVTAEPDIRIISEDYEGIEDQPPHPLQLDFDITDIDGSENATDITLTFTNLPTNTGEYGVIIIDTDRNSYTVDGPSTFTLTLADEAELQSVQFTQFPTHFSGIVNGTVNVVTDESGPAGQDKDFEVRILPDAEPEIDVFIDASEQGVTETGDDRYTVKEDNSFLLRITGQTPDQDGSERLTKIEIRNVPDGWLQADGSGNVDLSQFEGDTSAIASATLSGTTVTIKLKGGVTSVDTGLRFTPLEDDDRDLETIINYEDLEVRLTSVDTATGLPNDRDTASDYLDINFDAVVDPFRLAGEGSTVTEKNKGINVVPLGLTKFALKDNDGSEYITNVQLELTVATESDVFDARSELVLAVSDPSLAGFIQITQAGGSTADTVIYTLAPAGGATPVQFSNAVKSLEMEFPEFFSGQITADMTVDHQETTTPGQNPPDPSVGYEGDQELDGSDNKATSTLQLTYEVKPRVELELDTAVFAADGSFIADGSPQEVTATAKTGKTVLNSQIIEFLESTDDGSGPGQVSIFTRITASTRDLDGSEELRDVVIANVPTAWISHGLAPDGTTVLRGAFARPDGSGIISRAEWQKVDSATYDSATGELTITFKPDVETWNAALELQPSLYEDYDYDRQDSDPFTAQGSFFGDDMTITLRARDGNTVRDITKQGETGFDVDVGPVNNIAVIVGTPEGNEQVIDDAGGVWNVSFDVQIKDTDGSEDIISFVIRGLPAGVTVYVPDPDNPGGPKIPAVVTDIHPDGTVDWSLNNDQWLDVEFRGIPKHYAGDYPVEVEIVTEEANGTTGTTKLDLNLYVDPVADGGNPSEKAQTFEDTAFQVILDGNIIDNKKNSPGSPEAVLDFFTISDIQADPFGRLPRFFIGPPEPDPDNPGQYLNELTVSASGNLNIPPAEARNLWVLPPQDSNTDFVPGGSGPDYLFKVTALYYETIKPTETKLGEGFVTLEITGVADKPIVNVQIADPDDTTGPVIDQGDVHPDFRPDSTDPDGAGPAGPTSEENYHRIYGYAGSDAAAFLLNMRVTDYALENGLAQTQQDIDAGVPGAAFFQNAEPLTGTMTEIHVPGGTPFDGSETIYYIISGVPSDLTFLGGELIDASGSSYLVNGNQLATLAVVPPQVDEVTYYDLTFNTIVVEDVADLSLVSTGVRNATDPATGVVDVDALLQLLRDEPGYAVAEDDLGIVVLPDPDGGGDDCPEEVLLPPSLELIGEGDEDTVIELRLHLDPGGNPQYDDIRDLLNLPLGITGDIAIGISLPAGSSLSSNVPGAVVFDPATGLWAIDLDLLIGNTPPGSLDSENVLYYTPPAHQSSPVNPFDPSETFGPDDPYDNLTGLDYTLVINNISCGTQDAATGKFEFEIHPVVDGPIMGFSGPASFDEDTPYTPDISVTGPDGGERLAPGTGITITMDGDSGGRVFVGGTEISPTSVDPATGEATFEITQAQLPDLTFQAREHYSGPMTFTITATAEDIDGSTKSTSDSRTVDVIPVADVPEFIVHPDDIDPETGQPFFDDSTDTLTIIEDQWFTLDDALSVMTPDQDGSEVLSINIGIIPDYLDIRAPGASSFVNNGDGTYSIQGADIPKLELKLKDEHARTPDPLDPDIPAQIPITIQAFTLELANSDEEQADFTFQLQVRPDADKPTVTASIDPVTGVEDQPQPYVISLSGNTPDPHETIDFELSGIPDGSQVFLDGTPLTPSGGVVIIPGVGGAGINANTFVPDGTITFIPPKDFGGSVSLTAQAQTTDTSPLFTDTELSDPVQMDLDITVAPDLDFQILDDTVELDETDADVVYTPSDDVTVDVTDMDGSEVATVTYELTGVPAGTSGSYTGGSITEAGGVLTFTGTEAEFDSLQITFPADAATNGTPISGTVSATTNEGGSGNGTFTIDINGELDLTVTASPVDGTQDGSRTTVEFGIMADISPATAADYEWLEEVVITFDSPLPLFTTASAGDISLDRQTLTLTRGLTDPAAFAAAVAALSITVPARFTGDITGQISVSSNHGTAPDEPFSVTVANDGPPVVSGPVDISSTETSFTIPFSDLLANSSDATLPLTVDNVTSDDPANVLITVNRNSIDVDVPIGYDGTPVLSYDVVDADGLSSPATANLDINTLAMPRLADTVSNPNGRGFVLLDDITGTGTDIAKGTHKGEAVVYDAASRDYDGIAGFQMFSGWDFVDLSAATGGYTVLMGKGRDWVIGSEGDDDLRGGWHRDRLDGGGGADTLKGGKGDDIFVLGSAPGPADFICDYESPGSSGGDRIDLTALGQIDQGDITFDASSGSLSVNGTRYADVQASGGGIPAQVEVIFETAAGEATALV